MGYDHKILLDVPSRSPALGFAGTAHALKEIISESDPQFAIGIFGGWGSGKTTLMRAIRDELDQRHVIPVEFSAWRYEKEEHLIVPLLDTLREALVAWGHQHGGDDRNLARETASTVGKVMRSIVAGASVKFGVPGAIELSFDANKALEAKEKMKQLDVDASVPRSFYHASFRALREAFKGFMGSTRKRRIVVFVDDLDRCLPESALEVLESMKLFFDLSGFVFVVGLDQEVVQYVIDSKYHREDIKPGNGDAKAVTGRVSGEEYIKKIFQIPFRLAPVSVDQLADFLRATYDEADLSNEQKSELREYVEPHLRAVIGDAPVNPREIKRYINLYTLQTQMNPRLERHPILALQTIAFRSDWKGVQDAVLEFRQLFIGSLRRQVVEGEEKALQQLDPALDIISQDFLEYVGPGQPGHPLVEVQNIDEYIYSGEAVRSTYNPALLDAIHGVGTVRLALSKALDENDLRVDDLKLIRTQLGHVERALRSTTGDLATQAFRDLEEFSELLDVIERRVIEAPPFDSIRPNVATLDGQAAAISRRLRPLYHSGDIGPSHGPRHEGPASAPRRKGLRTTIPDTDR